MIISVNLLLNHVNKLREVLPLHLTAFMMKIEPHILDLFVLNFINDVGKCVSNALLRALLINKIYEDLLGELLLDFSHMLDGENSGILSILVYTDSRAPLHSGLLAPKGRNGATCLNVGGDPQRLTLFIECDNVLSFDKVGDISFSINSSHDESTARSPAVFLRNQSKVELL
jgi:hypothetical protein